MSWFSRKPQPKDEHPMQGVWDNTPSDPPQGGSVIASSEQADDPYCDCFPLSRSGLQPYYSPRSNPSIITEYGRPPAPQVDYRLIGEDQR